jgi:hypothetical protein
MRRASVTSRSISLPQGRYITKPADGMLDVAGVVVHNGGPTSTGNPTTGLHGNDPYSYPEAMLPLAAAAGIRWVRHDILPGNGAGSQNAFLTTPVCTANDSAVFTLYASLGLKAMVGVSDSRSLAQLQTYAAAGGIFSQLGWWPGIIEGINEDYNFLVAPYGNGRGTWTSGTAYAVGDAVSGARTGGAWYCLTAHTATSGNQPPDATSSTFLTAAQPIWVPQWAYTQLRINQQTTALRNATAGLAATLIADGGSANDAYLPTLAYTSQSMGLGGSLSADLLNVHNYASPAQFAVDAEVGLPGHAPLSPTATTKAQVILGETGLQCPDTDFGSGNNMVLGWFEAHRVGLAKMFGYHFMNDTGSYPTTVPSGVSDYGIVEPTGGTTVPWAGTPSSFPITAKPGYSLVKNMLGVVADPGAQLRNRYVDFHFTGTTPYGAYPLQRRNGQIDIPVVTTPAYGSANSPAAASTATTVVLDNGLTARQFQLYDPVANTWTSSAVASGQTSWALNPGLSNYTRLLRITPG